MKRLAVSLSVLALACGGATVFGATNASGVPLGQPCLPSVHSIGGQNYQVFCGSASASIKGNGHALKFRGGSCSADKTSFTVNVGAAYLGTPGGKATKPYFGIAMGKLPIVGQVGDKPVPSDGTYSNVPVTMVIDGAHYTAIRATVKLTHGRTAGSFTGTSLTGQPMSGSFTC